MACALAPSKGLVCALAPAKGLVCALAPAKGLGWGAAAASCFLPSVRMTQPLPERVGGR